jgi:hypothetical protein
MVKNNKASWEDDHSVKMTQFERRVPVAGCLQSEGKERGACAAGGGCAAGVLRLVKGTVRVSAAEPFISFCGKSQPKQTWGASALEEYPSSQQAVFIGSMQSLTRCRRNQGAVVALQPGSPPHTMLPIQQSLQILSPVRLDY